MSRQPKHVDVTTYLVVEPEWSQYNQVDGHPVLKGAKATRVTKNRPGGRREGVAVKITLRVPASVFLPLTPEAVIEILPGQVEPIVVTAHEVEREAEPEPQDDFDYTASDAGREDDE